MLKPFIFFLGVQIWYLETDVKAKLAFIFRYAGKDKLFYDLNSASYITKIRRKQCRWDPSSCFQLWTVVCPPASGDWASAILACKLSSSPTAVPQSRIKMSAGRRIIWSLSDCNPGSLSCCLGLTAALLLLCLEPILLRLASSFPCLVELGIGQNTLLTDSSLSSVAR